MDGKEFLEIHQNNMEILGFWDEDWKATILRVIESRYQKEIIREWGISDMVMNGEKVLLKWYKRYTPLSDEEMKKRFGEDKN
jgi:hypothetical protein